MNFNKPKLKLSCEYEDDTEKEITLDIDLSYDPLLGKPYVKKWIFHIIKINFECEKNIKRIGIIQTNIVNCKEDLPYWYYELIQNNER